ncbi:MAG: hypothetical protein BWY78_00271 [Alphaproteobacteria bacterium ADurb.Bin438]|nr:MAG: hypothetical protein BWY78_00271 [Alphaproteobacteria bacterium ADurb.Bin438]
MVRISNYINEKITSLFVFFMVFFIKITNSFAEECPTGDPAAIIAEYTKRAEDCSWGSSCAWDAARPNCFWFIKPLRTLFESMDQIGTEVYEKLAGINGNPPFAIPLLSVCFALWLAYQIMKYVSALYAQAPADFFMVIGTGIFKLCVAAALINWGAKDVFEHFVGLFVVTAANIGTELVNSVATQLPDVPPADIGAVATCDGSPIVQVAIAVQENTVAVARIFMEVVAYGKLLFNFSFEDGLMCVLPSIEPFINGIILMVAGTIFVCMIPLKFLDAIFRLTIVYSLMPLLLVAWVFPSTKKYTLKAWNMVVYSVFLFLVMSILFALCATMLGSYLLSSSGDVNSLSNAKNVFDFLSLEGQESKHSFLSVVVMIFISVKVMGSGKEIVSHFSDATDGGVADSTISKSMAKVGGTAAGVAMAIPQGLVEDGARKAGHFVIDKAEDATNAIRGGISSMGRKFSRKNDLEVTPEGKKPFDNNDENDGDKNIYNKLTDAQQSMEEQYNKNGSDLIVNSDEGQDVSSSEDKSMFESDVNAKLDDAEKKSSELNDETKSHMDGSKLKEQVQDDQRRIAENRFNPSENDDAETNKTQSQKSDDVKKSSEDNNGTKDKKDVLSQDEIDMVKAQLASFVVDNKNVELDYNDGDMRSAKNTVIDDLAMKKIEMERELSLHREKERMALSRAKDVKNETEKLKDQIEVLLKEKDNKKVDVKNDDLKDIKKDSKMPKFESKSEKNASLNNEESKEPKIRTLEEVENQEKEEKLSDDKSDNKDAKDNLKEEDK